MRQILIWNFYNSLDLEFRNFWHVRFHKKMQSQNHDLDRFTPLITTYFACLMHFRKHDF